MNDDDDSDDDDDVDDDDEDDDDARRGGGCVEGKLWQWRCREQLCAGSGARAVERGRNKTDTRDRVARLGQARPGVKRRRGEVDGPELIHVPR